MGKKKSKKRSLSESERMEKEEKDSANVPKIHKKVKSDNIKIVENGDASIKVVKKKKNRMDSVTFKKNENAESAPSQTKSGLNRQERRSLQMRQSILLGREKRKLLRREEGQYSTKAINFTADQLREKIKAIKSREKLSKTAIRKLAVLKKKLAIEEGTDNTKDTTENKKETLVKNKEKKQPGSLLRIKKSESDDSKGLKQESEKNIPSKNKKEKKKVAESEQDSKKDKNKLNDQKKASAVTQKEGQNAKQIPKKDKFVLVIQNLPFSATVDDVKEHFLTKVANIKSVRIPLKRGLKQSRGLAFIEFENSEDCEKALSLHSSVIKDRQISVQYSTPGSKIAGSKIAGSKKTVIAKNKKLSNFRKAKKLGKK